MSPSIYRECRRAGLFAVWLIPMAVAAAEHNEIRVPEATRASGEVILTGSWGTGIGQFGKMDEASRPGPMDFAMIAGVLYVLDPVNARVQVFDLTADSAWEIPIGTQTADFLHVSGDGLVAVLDAFVRREFRTFGADGALRCLAKLPDAISLPSAIMAEGGRVWIEERHNRVFELDVARARTREAAAIIESLPGRPARPGGFVHARKLADGAVILRVNTAVAGEQRCSLRFPGTVASVVALETDGDGRTYVAVRRENSAPPGGARSDLVVTRLRSCGPPAESLVLPDAYVTDHYRKVFVTVSGEVIQLQTTEAGVRFVRWAFEERLRRGAMP